MATGGEIVRSPRREIIQAEDAMALMEERSAELRADKSRAASDEYSYDSSSSSLVCVCRHCF